MLSAISNSASVIMAEAENTSSGELFTLFKPQMALGEMLLDAAIIMIVVFGVLFIMYVLISLAGKVIAAAVKSEEKPLIQKAAPAAPAEPAKEEEFSSGSLKLKGCDEKTAAMIMAIVSDNTGIPLNELIFKSITLVEE